MVCFTIKVGTLITCASGIIGRDKGEELNLLVVYGVVVPPACHIRDVGNHHTLVGDVCVPSLLSAVFEHVVLVGVERTCYLVGHIGALLLLVPHGQSVLCALYRSLQVDPAHEVFLVTAVANGSVAVIVIAATVHQAPRAYTPVVVGVSCLVEVGQSQAVTELVAESAHAVATAVNLVEHGKFVDGHAVAGYCAVSVAIVGAIAELPLAGPNGVGYRVAGLSLAHAGIHHDAHVHQAVAVVVVLTPIHRATGLADGVAHHLAHTHVVAVTVVLAVGGARRR